jgi:protein gp37
MADSVQHRFVILTKRAERMKSEINDFSRLGLPPHIAVGVSVEDHDTACSRVHLLTNTNAKTRIISVEPLLENIELGQYLHNIQWVIVGGESGKHARPMAPQLARSIRDECISNDVPFFFKQWGEFDAFGSRVGKKNAGDFLAGQQLHQFPRAWEHGLAVA